ncbi:MAG: TauD/TfdA family dioxygenase [Arenicellales bacterium]|nr:TauD/TfdA family dioxygenase [Arenicellales bacterium]
MPQTMLSKWNGRPLNGAFGALIENVNPKQLADPVFGADAYQLWTAYNGLLIVRGPDLAFLTPESLLRWGEIFGTVDRNVESGRDFCQVDNLPIIRIGNTVDHTGTSNAIFANEPLIKNAADVRYNPETRTPVWHTDGTFKPHPPIGSVFHCRQAPTSGGATLFADMCSALEMLADPVKEELSGLEAVCSLAHHDKKINLSSPTYPTLTPTQRADNPPMRVPLMLTHPISGKPALYGLNSSTCAVVSKHETITQERMDVFDLQGIEHESVATLRNLLPTVTGPDFTVRWTWAPGDIVVWDNRCTLHAGTGFNSAAEQREMWRLSLTTPEPLTSNTSAG